MLNRTQAPELKSIDKIDFIAPEIHPINEFVSLYHMKNVPNETSRFDLYFDAGKCRGEHGISGFVNGLLLSGTDKKTSIQINSEINQLGGFQESGVSLENASFTMYALRENLVSILRTVCDSIQHLAFLPNEVNELIADRKQKHRINSEKVSYLAQRAFQKNLFHSNPLYAAVIEENDFENIQLEELKEFHRKYYIHGLERVVVVGDFSEQEIQEMIDLLREFAIDHQPEYETTLQHLPGRINNEKDGALQSAIRLGKILFNKKHDDYLDFLVLNTIIGDYFGSRLMTNIREDKGYTYGIGSAIIENANTGYFVIATEVGKDVCEDALKEIKYELERLQNELVPEEELELVTNYMLGQLLKSADGPYAMTDLFLSAEIHGESLEFYNRAIASLHSIRPERIQELAKKYLNWNEMVVVSAG